MGWLYSDGVLELIPAANWEREHAETHVCELQLHVAGMHTLATRWGSGFGVQRLGFKV